MQALLEKPNLGKESETPTRLRDRLFGRTVIRALQQRLESTPALRRPQEAVGRQIEKSAQVPQEAIDSDEDTGRHHIDTVRSGERKQTTVDELLTRQRQEQVKLEQRQKLEWEQQFDPTELAEVYAKQNHYKMALADPSLMIAPNEVHGIASFTPPKSEDKMPSNNYTEAGANAVPAEEYKIPAPRTHDMN